MKKLILAPILALAMLVGGAVAPSSQAVAKVPLVESVVVQDSCACGGEVYVVWTVIYNIVPGPARCIRQWSNGVQTDTLCW